MWCFIILDYRRCARGRTALWRQIGPCEFDRSPTGCTYIYIYIHTQYAYIHVYCTCNGVTHYYYYYYYRRPPCQPVVLFDSVDVSSYNIMHANDIIYSTWILYITLLLFVQYAVHSDHSSLEIVNDNNMCHTIPAMNEYYYIRRLRLCAVRIILKIYIIIYKPAT